MPQYYVAVPVSLDNVTDWTKHDEVLNQFANRLGVEPHGLRVHRIHTATEGSSLESPLSQPSEGGNSIKVVAFLSDDACQVMAEEVLTPESKPDFRNSTPSDQGGLSTSGMATSIEVASLHHPSASANTAPQPTDSTRLMQASQRENALLRAEIEDLRAKIAEITQFKNEVLDTIKLMKKEVATISEDLLLSDSHDM
jgi:hypothetical protein